MSSSNGKSRLFVATLTDLSGALAVPLATLSRWRSCGAPGKGRWGWDVGAWCRWADKRPRRRARTPDEVDERRLKVKLARERLALKRERAAQVPIEEYRQALQARTAWALRLIDAIPGDMVRLLRRLPLDEWKPAIEAYSDRLRAEALGAP